VLLSEAAAEVRRPPVVSLKLTRSGPNAPPVGSEGLTARRKGQITAELPEVVLGGAAVRCSFGCDRQEKKNCPGEQARKRVRAVQRRCKEISREYEESLPVMKQST
jgi:hypothetical protein